MKKTMKKTKHLLLCLFAFSLLKARITNSMPPVNWRVCTENLFAKYFQNFILHSLHFTGVVLKISIK